MNDSFDLFLRLANHPPSSVKKREHIESGCRSEITLFETLLAGRSSREKAQKSIHNLHIYAYDSLQAIIDVDTAIIAELIKPSGFVNRKAPLLKRVALRISEDFGSFEGFCASVEREWLVAISGIGPETADIILLFVCCRETIPVNRHIAEILAVEYDIDGLEYDELQEWLLQGIYTHADEATKMIHGDIGTVLRYFYELLCAYHPKIQHFE